jgi:hypothetical protein
MRGEITAELPVMAAMVRRDAQDRELIAKAREIERLLDSILRPKKPTGNILPCKLLISSRLQNLPQMRKIFPEARDFPEALSPAPSIGRRPVSLTLVALPTLEKRA